MNMLGAPKYTVNIGFHGKAESPFNFIDLLLFTFSLPTGVLGM
jgi:hypothetical protein